MSIRIRTLLPILAVFGLGACDRPTAPTTENYAEGAVALKAKYKDLPQQDMRVMKDVAARLAAAMPDPGLKVGERAPDFELPNAFGHTISLYKELEKGPVVVTFYRGAWCPFCNLQLHGLQSALPLIEEQGARLIAITPQQPDKSRDQLKKERYQFEVLSDLDDRVTKAYRLHYIMDPKLVELYKTKFKLDVSAFNGPGRNVLPVPATFVVDRDGIVRAAFADTDYTKRMEPAQILSALKALSAK